MASLDLKPEWAAKIVWGHPDSPQRDLCAICHGGLDDVPLRIWKGDGSAAAFCDDCAKQAFGY